MWTIALSGMLTGLALIVAIGAQNAYILRQGIRREHVSLVVVVCTLSDVILILAGTAGIGAIIGAAPWLLDAFRWGGAVYLLWFAIQSIRSALQPQGLTAEAPRSRGSILTTTLALTWLNPHVYLDTVILLGSLANQHGPDLRWVFATGAVVGSAVWFTALGFGARALSKALASPRSWQVLDILIAIVMTVLAIKLMTG